MGFGRGNVPRISLHGPEQNPQISLTFQVGTGQSGAMRYNIPYARAGQVIGLLGGSFDPAHEGHAHITREAMKRFGLDQVWWMVSPGNPLKKHGPQPIKDRIAHAEKVMVHPRVKITDIECHLGTRYTAQTLDKLFRLYPGVRFVWLMGADNLAEFHHWDQWKWIMRALPVGVIARPGQRVAARLSPAARIFGGQRLKGLHARALPALGPPVWSLVNVPMLPHSSSEIRARGDWANGSDASAKA